MCMCAHLFLLGSGLHPVVDVRGIHFGRGERMERRRPPCRATAQKTVGVGRGVRFGRGERMERRRPPCRATAQKQSGKGIPAGDPPRATHTYPNPGPPSARRTLPPRPQRGAFTSSHLSTAGAAAASPISAHRRAPRASGRSTTVLARSWQAHSWPQIGPWLLTKAVCPQCLY